MTKPVRHIPDEVLRGYAVGAASEGANLAVACHIAFCSECRANAAAHESVLDVLARAVSSSSDEARGPGAALRDRLLASLPPQPAPPAPRPPAAALPKDLPELPAPLLRQLESLERVTWRRLVPGIRVIDLGIRTAWRARVVYFRAGIPIPVHDHGGPEHTVVFSGGLDDENGHLGRGDGATMMPGDTHRQRSAPGEPCVALIVNEGPPRPLTFAGRVLKRLTRS